MSAELERRPPPSHRRVGNFPPFQTALCVGSRRRTRFRVGGRRRGIFSAAGNLFLGGPLEGEDNDGGSRFEIERKSLNNLSPTVNPKIGRGTSAVKLFTVAIEQRVLDTNAGKQLSWAATDV